MALVLGTSTISIAYRPPLAIWIVVVIVFVISIVGSRMCTGMHGFTDRSLGVITIRCSKL